MDLVSPLSEEEVAENVEMSFSISSDPQDGHLLSSPEGPMRSSNSSPHPLHLNSNIGMPYSTSFHA
jgi:hypothetical protein